MEIVDELVTPGCPQCAVKHLSAALYHKAKLAGADFRPDPYMVEVCLAYINLAEVKAGYLSHLWYAVGALVRAEERMAPRMVGECVARNVRLVLEQHGVDALIDALNMIETETVPDHADWATAHFCEALRELPVLADQMTMDNILETIERIREEYFVHEEVPAASTERAEKGGES